MSTWKSTPSEFVTEDIDWPRGIFIFCVFCLEVIEYIRNVFQEVNVVGLGCCEFAQQFEVVFVCVLQVSSSYFTCSF